MGLDERVKRLEAAIESENDCPACQERARHITVKYPGMEESEIEEMPDECPACGHKIEVLRFTIKIGDAVELEA